MRKQKQQTAIEVIFIAFMVFFLMAGNVYAHCDTLDGPVVADARKALAEGNVTPVLKWVSSDDEDTIRMAFRHTLSVRKLGNEARQLADMYFFETLVRIHRNTEGAPYTGLKPGTAIDPVIALADKALESGSVDKLVDILTDATAKAIRERFHRTLGARNHADEKITSGREYVKAYVTFTHYVEGIHTLIKGGSAHHGRK
jgi:hypothetical protein